MNKLLSSVTLLIILFIVISCAVRSQKELSKKGMPVEPAKSFTMKTHESEFGFSIELSSRWTVLSGEVLKENPDLIERFFEILEKTSLRKADKNIMKQMKMMVLSGGVEYYFHQDYPGAHINVAKDSGRIPRTNDKLNVACKMIPGMYSRMLGKSVKVYKCELRKIGSLAATYIVLDYPEEGCKNIQYQIQKSPNVKLLIGAFSENQYFEMIKKEFHEIMETFELNKTGD